MISVNQQAEIIVRQMIAESEILGLGITVLKNRAVVVDAGIHACGSMEAGRLFARACLGGLGCVSFSHKTYAIAMGDIHSTLSLPAVCVDAAHPPLACMAAQYAGWPIKYKNYSAIGSGPARALYAGEEIFKKLEYRDKAETAVLMLEGRQFPDADVADYIADQCNVSPASLLLLIAPTASLVGSIQIAARSVETGMHKLAELGFDVRKIKAALGVCPLPTVAADDIHAIGRTNDAILYGSEIFLTVDAEDEELAALIDKIPSSSSSDYGTPFYELFRQCGGDFYRIDRMLFSPACITINNLPSGRVFAAGSVHAALLQASLLGR